MQTSDLQRINAQLSHPDAFFYDIEIGEYVSGFFEGDETGILFCISTESFVSSAYTLGYIGAYEPQTKRCWDANNYDGNGMTFRKYAEYTVEDQNPRAQEIIRHAIECEWDNHLTRLAREISRGAATSSVKDRIKRTVDAAFCDAVEELAAIIREANAEKEVA